MALLNQIPQNKKKLSVQIVLFSLVVILAGVGTGWFLSSQSLGQTGPRTSDDAPETQKINGAVGLEDESTFKDTAQGVLKSGGIDGEGTHHLERDGGESQNVYLTSTVIDLESFVGKEVQIWGETISGTKAGWLMDVGKIKEL